MIWEALITAAAPQGLILMGTCHEDDDTLALLGAGSGMWPVFTASAEYRDGAPDPLDRWSKRVIGALAEPLRAKTAFPSDGPPYAPFIGWALATGRFWQSPVGMLVHDEAGLMVSIRGALRLPGKLPLKGDRAPHPCNGCETQPCTTACPVQALSAEAVYDVDACKGHLSRPEGADCMETGCAARRACPISWRFGRDPAQSAFHMAAFMGN